LDAVGLAARFQQFFGRYFLPLLLIGVTIGGWNTWIQHALLEPGPLDFPRHVSVPTGDNAEIADALGKLGVIAGRWQFRALIFATRSQGPLHGGDFDIPAHAAPIDVLRLLRK
jgi:cell division protein YceG involved in septum cleavage